MKMTYPHTFSFIFMTTPSWTTYERQYKHTLIQILQLSYNRVLNEPDLLYFDQVLFRTNGARLHCFLRCIDKTQDERIRTSTMELQSQGRTEGLTRTEKSPFLTELTHVPRGTPTCRGPLLRSVRLVGTFGVGVYPLIIQA